MAQAGADSPKRAALAVEACHIRVRSESDPSQIRIRSESDPSRCEPRQATTCSTSAATSWPATWCPANPRHVPRGYLVTSPASMSVTPPPYPVTSPASKPLPELSEDVRSLLLQDEKLLLVPASAYPLSNFSLPASTVKARVQARGTPAPHPPRPDSAHEFGMHTRASACILTVRAAGTGISQPVRNRPATGQQAAQAHPSHVIQGTSSVTP